MAPELTAQKMAEVFDTVFLKSENTRMVTGAIEPFYIPAGQRSCFSDGSAIESSCAHRIFSREDYAASVLHEAAHWCIAGEERRRRIDYGYWYEPDGRNAVQQAEFEKVEVKPQALERIFCQAAGLQFRVSVDNASCPEISPSRRFVDAIHAQCMYYLENGLPPRAERFALTLAERFRGQTMKPGNWTHCLPELD